MSDSNVPSTPETTESAKTEPADAPAAKPKKGKWRRRLLKTLFGLVLFFVVIRIGLFFLLAVTLRKVANFYDLDLVYQRQEITLLGGDAGLWGVKVSRKGESSPFLEADYVHGNLSVLALLRTHIEIWRMEADGVLLDVTRTPDGKIPLLDLVMAQMSGTAVAKTPNNTPLDLSSPFKIDALRLHRFRAKISDLAVQPAFHETLYADVRVSDLRNPEKPTSIEADVWSDSVLTAMRFNGTGTAEGRVVNLEAMFRGGGLNLGPVAQYLKPLGLNPVARSIDWNGKLKVSTDVGPTPTSITAKLNLSNVSATADTAEVISVKTVELSAKSIGADGVSLSELAVDGVRVHAGRSTDGRLRFAGIELITPPPATQPTTRNIQLAPAKPATTSPSANPFFVTLDAFKLRDLEASFGDQALAQPTTLVFHIDELKTTAIQRDKNGRVVVPLKGSLRAPGMAEAIAIDGSIQPFEQPYELTATLNAQHIKPDAIKAYLAPLGLSSTLDDASLTGSLLIKATPTDTGGVTASLKLSQLVLQDAATRLAMPLVRVDGVQIEPGLGSIVVNDAELIGPELSASREADGSIRGVGMQYRPPTPVANHTTPTTKPTTQLVELPVFPALPRIELKQVKWSGTKLDLVDNMMSPAREFHIADLGAELQNVVIDLSNRPGESHDGKINGYLSLPGVVNRFAVTGTFERVPNRTSFNVDVTGNGLKSSELAAYLSPLGIEPQLNDGSLTLKVSADLKLVNQALSADLSLKNLSLKEGDRELAGIRALRVEQLEVDQGAISSKLITIDGPVVSAKRLKDGSLESGGVRLLPTKIDPLALPVPGPVLPIPYSPVPIRVTDLKVTGARASWTDEAANLPVSLVLTADAQLSNVALSLPGDPATFSASGSIDGVAKQFTATGLLDVDPAQVFFSGHIEATGITGSAIDGYLPPGTKTTLRDASFSVDASASILPVDETGQSLSLSVRDLKLTQGGAVLAAVPSVEIDLPLIDLEKNEVQIRSLVVSGASIADVEVRNDSTINLPGLWVGPPPVEAAPVEPAAIVVSADGKPQGDDQLAQRLAAARKPLPYVRIEKLDLGVEHVGVALEARGSAAPVSLDGLHVTNAAPIEIGGAKAADLPPVQLKILTELKPLVKQVEINVAAAPFASEATVVGTLDAKQINGQGLLELVPEIASLVDGSSLTEGSFKASLDAKLRVARRTPTEFDLRRGFEGEIKFADITYRTTPDAEPEAGVESITMEGVRVQPAFAGGTVKLLTVNKPLARLLRDKEGIHVLGWTIKLPAAGEEISTQPTEETAPTAALKSEVAKSDAKPQVAPPGPEFKIDKLLISGSDVLVRDISVEPALVVPINALDVEVKGLSNRALVEDRTIRFSALVGTDKVELPTRAKRGEVARAATEMRPLMSQVAATGNLRLFPTMDGYVKASVNGFEMQSLIGEAKALGITLGDGIFDGTFDARFRDGGNLDLKAKLVTTDLKLSEGPNGLLSRTFNLGVTPIDVAIGLAEDASGSITFPVSAPIRGGEVNVGSVIGSVIGGVGQVFVTAIASAPLKVMQGMGSMLGIQGNEEAPKPPVVLTFLPGDTSLEPALRKSLDELIIAMKKDPNLSVTLSHKLSSLDANRAGVLASPTRTQIELMTGELRTRRMVLINQRAVSAADFSAELASGSSSPAAMSALQQLDRQIVSNDDALERLLDLTRPGAELQGDRRMKAAAIDIGTARLALARAYLEAAKIERIGDRLSVSNPRFEIDESLEAGGVVSIEQIVKKRAK